MKAWPGAIGFCDLKRIMMQVWAGVRPGIFLLFLHGRLLRDGGIVLAATSIGDVSSQEVEKLSKKGALE
jgi:hypothetical protein